MYIIKVETSAEKMEVKNSYVPSTESFKVEAANMGSCLDSENYMKSNVKKRSGVIELTYCESSKGISGEELKVDREKHNNKGPDDRIHAAAAAAALGKGGGTRVERLLGGGGGAKEKDEEGTGSLMRSVSHGMVSVIGRRKEMEDAVMITVIGEVDRSYDFFGVYDGHGGSRVAKACRERMHRLVAEDMEAGTRYGGGGGKVEYWEEVMATSFARMDEEVREEQHGDRMIKMMGSTAVVVMVGEEEVVVANCGDSRVVLSRAGFALPLSRDHKPDRPDEMERVEAAGGRILNWNGSRVLGILATSRSIGDHYLKPFVISKPEVTVSKRTKSDDFLVIASDGLWDVISNQIACEFVRGCLDGKMKRKFPEGVSGSCAAEAAAILAELAMARGSKDNISVIVVELRKSSSSIS